MVGWRLRDTNHFVLLPGEMLGIFIPHNIGTYWAGAGTTWSDDTHSSQLTDQLCIPIVRYDLGKKATATTH